MSEVVRSAARVLDLLEYFASTEQGATLAAVSQLFALPKSSALGLLRTLSARGYLVRDAQGEYRLNAVFRERGFGWGGDRLTRLCAIVEPVMVSLSERLGETVSLGELTEAGQIRIVERALSNQSVRYETHVNQTLPAYSTAMGRMLLSTLPDTKRAALLALQSFEPVTPVTITDPERIKVIIAQAGEDGYCIVEDESELGGTGVATCISSGPGRPIIALNVGCISARFAEKRERVIAAVTQEAAKLRDILAH